MGSSSSSASQVEQKFSLNQNLQQLKKSDQAWLVFELKLSMSQLANSLAHFTALNFMLVMRSFHELMILGRISPSRVIIVSYAICYVRYSFSCITTIYCSIQSVLSVKTSYGFIRANIFAPFSFLSTCYWPNGYNF